MGNKTTISIKKNSISYFLMIIPFIPIAYLTYLTSIFATIFSYARVVVIVILLVRLFLIRRKFTVTLGLALLYFVAGFFSTFIAGQSYYTLLYDSSYLLGLTLLVEDGVFFDADAFVDGCLIWFEILIYANLLYFILQPNGYQENFYLFGNYNSTIRYIFPGFILGAIHAFRLKNRITLRFCCMFLAFLYFLIRVGSMTSIFGMLIFIIAILFYMWRKKSGLFKFEFFIVLSLALTYFFAILGRFNIFENIITNIFRRSMTLSGRTVIWSRTILEISKRPIWGYGELNIDETRGLLNGATDPHNMYLGTLFYGGIIGIVVLSIILLVILRQIRSCRKYSTQIAMIFDAGFCAYFLMWNFESFSNVDEFYKIFLFFVMAYYCVNFAKGINKSNDSDDKSILKTNI